jgi:hypothetical protein
MTTLSISGLDRALFILVANPEDAMITMFITVTKGIPTWGIPSSLLLHGNQLWRHLHRQVPDTPPTQRIDWLWWGETMSQNCGHQPVYCSSSASYASMESHGMMMLAGDNAWLVYQSSMAVIPAETSGASRRNGRRSGNFSYQYLKYLKGSLICRKILRHGTSGFISHPKEGVLRICIALKNPSPRPGFKPATLGSSGKHTNHYTTEATTQRILAAR